LRVHDDEMMMTDAVSLFFFVCVCRSLELLRRFIRSS
jgi:hypothetical protein